MNMALKTIVAFAVIFTSFAQAGEGEWSTYLSPDEDGVVSLHINRSFGGSSPRNIAEPIQIASIVDNGVYSSPQVCEQKARDGTVVVYSPGNRTGYSRFLPLGSDGKESAVGKIGHVVLKDGTKRPAMIDISEAGKCLDMNTTEGRKWVYQPAGTLLRYWVTNGKRDERPYALHACGNQIFLANTLLAGVSLDATSRGFTQGGVTVVINNNVGVASNGSFDGVVKDKSWCERNPGWCKAAKGAGWAIAGIAVTCAVVDNHCRKEKHSSPATVTPLPTVPGPATVIPLPTDPGIGGATVTPLPTNTGTGGATVTPLPTGPGTDGNTIAP